MTLDVQVLYSDGKPVKGTKVHAHFDEPNGISDFLRGGGMDEYTDDNGHAVFETTVKHEGTVSFSCRGHRTGPHDVEDGSAYTIQF
jgi:uncharacterized GH25 family protein